MISDGEDAGALTYAELDARAAAVAARLGPRPGQMIGVVVPRSADLVVALLGVFRAGAAYVALDPDPGDHLEAAIAEAGVGVVVTVSGAVDRLPPGPELVLADAVSGARPPAPPATAPDDAAYAPAPGVTVPHRTVVEHLDRVQRAHGLRAGDRVLQSTPTRLDLIVRELFWPLLTGATVVMARPGGHGDPSYLAALVADRGITTLPVTAATLEALLADERVVADPSWAATLRVVVVGGEPPRADVAPRWHALTGVPLHLVDDAEQVVSPGVPQESTR